MLGWSTHFWSSLVRGGEYQQHECEKIAFNPRQTRVHPPVADTERKWRRTGFPPLVCDLGIFTSRPKRRVV
ncbi:hypothetical protein N7449_003199 [Penicillium cf. viridicatum]|uniref:Uncharacterized protein n=1 Tax=Penicillium cf. viridicatum TaxID=2972119 RepID=A0A9W9T522_9EURO|nr:hypothetical protein N7449_003199 [Penicillium cf. viridicatum]